MINVSNVTIQRIFESGFTIIELHTGVAITL